EILLATPGRLLQLLQKDLLNMSDVRMLIFDEADEMLDQGFLPDSDTITSACPKDVQMAMFTATLSASVQDLINMQFTSAEVIRTSGAGKTVTSLTTHNRTVKDGVRWEVFETILAKPIAGGTLVFVNTREQCDKLAKEIVEKGYNCAVYRGEMDKNDRRANLKKFREGKIDILVSTDLAARGLDLEHVGRVVNFHLPRQMVNYLHRAGRTARAGKPGVVINLVTERDQRLISQLNAKTPKVDPNKGEMRTTAATKASPTLPGRKHSAVKKKKAKKLGFQRA
ncbi:MAG: DEAD/DEAH box helicase, partial [Bdellovibrionaceae bacterium]|nr:DEAD/DEAH box helicase [Pseudobdellovibrionaceae bacterium]